MDRRSESRRLAERFARKAGAGLLDVRFAVRNQDEATPEAVCSEVNRLYEAVEAGIAKSVRYGAW